MVADDRTRVQDFDFYLKRPFEVFYPTVPVVEFELLGKEDSANILNSLAVRKSYGTFYSQTFSCDSNSGQQLLCCILGQHDELKPGWLEHIFVDSEEPEEDEKWHQIDFYRVKIKDQTVSFHLAKRSESEKIKGLPSLNLETLLNLEFSVGDPISPEYYILDAKETRLKVTPEGEILSEAGEPTGISLFQVDDLWDMWDGEGLDSIEVWEAKDRWLKRVLLPYFPKDACIELAPDSD